MVSLGGWVSMAMLHCSCSCTKPYELHAAWNSVSAKTLGSSSCQLKCPWGCGGVSQLWSQRSVIRMGCSKPISLAPSWEPLEASNESWCLASWCSVPSFLPFQPRDLHLPCIHSHCLLSEYLFRECQSTRWSAVSWWEKLFWVVSSPWLFLPTFSFIL